VSYSESDPFDLIERVTDRESALTLLRYCEAVRRLIAHPLDAWSTPDELAAMVQDQDALEQLLVAREIAADPRQQFKAIVALDVHCARMRAHWQVEQEEEQEGA
jgi:hypothetical protein